MKLFLRFSGQFLMSFVFQVGFLFSIAQGAIAETAHPVVGIISFHDKKAFESDIFPAIAQQMQSCKKCEHRNLTPYTEQGTFDSTKVAEVLTANKNNVQIMFLNWNAPATDKTKEVSKLLREMSNAGIIIVASAGLAQDGGSTVALIRTVVGQVPQALILGELTGRERLLTQSFFGPEMLTAVKPPKDLESKSLVGLPFVAKLSTQWSKRSPDEWVEHFRETKARSRRLWPQVDEFFR